MDRILLKQKYQALEQATAGRLETFNGIIREERRNRNASKEKIDYFNEKRKIIMRELNLIREAIKRNNFNLFDYGQIHDKYLKFDINI